MFPMCLFTYNIVYCGIIWVTFLSFDFCRFCVVIRFFHPRHNGQWPPTSKDCYPRSYPLHHNSSDRARITGTIYITSLVWRGPCLGILNPGPPALDASTLPLGGVCEWLKRHQTKPVTNIFGTSHQMHHQLWLVAIIQGG